MLSRLLILLTIISVSACKEPEIEKLPFIGFHEIVEGDTAYYKIPNFSFLDQDSSRINNRSLSESIYIADFFYTYCPTICPRVKSQMLRVYEKYENEDKLKLISFALDPKRDDVDNLNTYAENLEVQNEKWHFLTGDKNEIWELAEKYLISVREDAEEPGGIFHSGKILLIDSNGHIRGFANGTETDEVNELMNKIDLLLEETR